MTVRALVLAGFGLNCDFETTHALQLAGASADRVHISQLTGTALAPPTARLDGYHILVFDGGFSWGDDHGAGVLLATRLANHLGQQLRDFLGRGGLVIGICNGFQALVNLGLLPLLEGAWQRDVALINNDCGNFQDRWVELLAEPASPCLFTRGLRRLSLPVRHGEGKLVALPAVLERLEALGLVALRYANAKGQPAGGRFPHNPNGSLNDIAGICDPTGRVFGLMPHPEGFYRQSQHPDWTLVREAARRRGEEPDALAPGLGQTIFTNAVAVVRGTLVSNKRQNLAGLKEGQAVDEVYLLARKQIFATKGGKPYGSLRLMDPTGEVEAKLWEQAEDLLTPLAVGSPVRVQGKAQLYNGQTQLVLTALGAAPQSRAADFLPKSPRDPGQMWAELGALKQSVKNMHLKKLLRAFFDDPEFRQVFELAPAAKGAHHAYVHGLLEHTVSLGRLAELLAAHYPHLDRDLLLTGALLHDIGKVQELVLGPPLDYSDLGRLEGHVVLGVRMLDARLARQKGFPARLASHLRHLIISHHGQEEFGSPQKPKLPEAMALHQLDDLDAKTAMVKGVIEAEAGGEGHWSNFHRLLERHIYTGPPPWDDEPEPGESLAASPPPSEPEPASEPQAPARPAKAANQDRPSLFDQAAPSPKE